MIVRLVAFLAVICKLQGVELEISQAIVDAELQALVIPEEHAYKIPTLNQYGYMFTKFDPVTERFLQLIEEKPEQAFFEVGGAYGNVAQAALEKGIDSYYLNDCEERHLKSFVKKLKDEGREHLFHGLRLIHSRCPDFAIASNSFDAILVNKVLHFFTPDTIDVFVHWLHQILKPGGRVFVMTVSPFFAGNEEFLDDYQKKKQKGVRFPGYRSLYHASQFAQTMEVQTRPVSLLFMELEALKDLFVQQGFQIQEGFELEIIDSDNHEWKPGKDMVGIIASKKII
jgi:ubiquinone/menaquinone biosynthesis C-methylase UbiE